MPTEPSFTWWRLATLIFSVPGATIVIALIVLFALLLVLIFRDRLKGLSVGFGNYKFTFEEKPVSTLPQTAVAGASSDQASIAIPPTDDGAPVKDSSGSRYQALVDMNAAIESRNREGIQAAFSALRASPPWEITDEELDAWKQGSLLRAGFSDGLAVLVRMEAEAERKPYASRQLSRYYLRMKAFDEAALHAEIAVKRSRSEDDISTAYLLMAEVLKEKQDGHHSAKYLIESVGSLSDKKEISRIYAEIGNQEKSMGNNSLASAAYEIALKADMRNDNARFAMAYLSSTKEVSRLMALRHYQIYLESEVGSTVATNNLGVLYGELGLAISKVRYWKRAQKNDDGFATGNLGRKPISASGRFQRRRFRDSSSERGAWRWDATNSAISNGRRSSRTFPTSRAAYPVLMIGAS